MIPSTRGFAPAPLAPAAEPSDPALTAVAEPALTPLFRRPGRPTENHAAEASQVGDVAAEAARAVALLRVELAATRLATAAEIASTRAGAAADLAEARQQADAERADHAVRQAALLDELAELRAATARDLASETASRRRAEARMDQAHQERDALLDSTAWRVTWPLRWLGGVTPGPVRWHSRRALKLAWWAATPWRIPRRVRVLRERRVSVGGAVSAAEGDRALLPASDALRRIGPPRDEASPLPALVPRLPQMREREAYARWIAEVEPTLHAPLLGTRGRSFGQVRFSFLIAGADQPTALLATLDSLGAQDNPDWEALIAAPDGPAGDAARRAAALAVAADRRISLVSCPRGAAADKGAALTALLPAATGAYIAVLDAGDALAPGALDEVAHALAHAPGAAILYSDEDELSATNTREKPCLKPSWSPELLHAYNYFGRLTILARSVALDVGGFTPGTGAAAEWDCNLRAADAAGGNEHGIVRIPRVLCHRAPEGDHDRPAPASTTAAQHRAALRAYWSAHGIQDPHVETQRNGTQRSTWVLPDPPLVSIIIPNRNSARLLRQCLDGVLDGTEYRRVEIVVVDNRSDDRETLALYETLRQRPNLRVVSFDRPFNYSAACNHGAAFARGALLLFLNNDIEITDPGWLGELVRVATRPGVGVVGLKLRYPNGQLQHGGVAVGIHLYGLMWRHAREGGWGVFGSPDHPRNWLAIMGACQMVRREVFDAVGGFDEAYGIANSDVALCLRAYRAGWRTAYTPYAELTHHEGATRGRTNPLDDMIRSAAEVRRLGFDDDPYLHPGLSALDPIPRLRAAGEPDPRESLAHDVERYLIAGLQSEAPLDPFDDGAVQRAAGLPREFVLWPPQPAVSVSDQWSLARWVLDLLRARPDLRARFPRALSAGADGAFAAWLEGEGGDRLGLSPAARAHLQPLFAGDPAARTRQLYLGRDELRATHPLGLLAPGRSGLAGWLLRQGHPEYGLRLEEAWWLILACAEDPAGELVRTYLFTPAWQEAHPCGLTVFGRDAFAAWVARRYYLPPDAAGWLEPAAWPVDLTPAEQVRLAYAAREEWRLAHPRALDTEQDARALLTWLAGPDAGLPTEVRAWCAEREGDGTAAALATAGVNIIASFCYPSGLRVSAETMSDAMELAGALVSRRDMRTHPGDDPDHAGFGGLEIHDTTLIHVQPEPYFGEAYARADLAERTPRTYRIAYWYWELDLVPEWWAEAGRAVDEVWAATGFVADALRKVLSVPVRTMFPGVRIGPFTRRPREAFGLPGGGRFAFLFSFHMSSIMERKNPLALVRAFQQAFRPDEPVDLVIKTTSFGHDAQVAQLREAGAGANVHVLDRAMALEEALSLMESCDAYVSLHHSEGLGLTMAEAMLLGKPCIATRFSGNLDFMDDGNSLLVDCDIVPLGRPVPPYDASGHWAEPSVDHAAQLMRRVYENQAWAAELGAKAQADARVRLSLDAAGRRMAARLAQIRAGRRGPSP